jgi:hypothetical protein
MDIAPRRLPMQRQAVGRYVVALLHAIVPDHAGDAQAVISEIFLPAFRLRLAMGLEVAPFLDRRLIPEKGK